MRPLKWYNLNVCHVIGSWCKSSFSQNTTKHFFVSTKSIFSLGKNIGGTRHLCEKNESTLDRFWEGGGGGGAR